METAPRTRSPKCYKLTPHREKDDPFTRLSDDIIGHHILSRLPVKEATRTTVLARRWRKLWTYNICPTLVFSYSQDSYFDAVSIKKHKLLQLGDQLICGINKTMEAYRKPRIDELAIRFDVGQRSWPAIDRSVEFAFRKGVSRLELDFSSFTLPGGNTWYTFPSIEKLSALHVLCDNHLHQPVVCAGLYNLKNICLKYVNISSELTELMLSDSPSLEHLCIWGSNMLREVKVTEKSVKLKSLEFVNCYHMKLKISSSTLVSLKYIGKATMSLEHVPSLSEVSIGGEYCRSFLRSGAQNFGYICQLSRLSLDITLEAVHESITYAPLFPELMKLELLEVMMFAYDNSCLLWPIILINAAPNLHRFSVEVRALADKDRNKKLQRDQISNLKCTISQVRHQCLKVIEMRGFMGFRQELELGQYLLGVSQSLEQVVVAPRLLGRRKEPHPRDDICMDVKEYRESAKALNRWLPSGAKLVVL